MNEKAKLLIKINNAYDLVRLAAIAGGILGVLVVCHQNTEKTAEIIEAYMN